MSSIGYSIVVATMEGNDRYLYQTLDSIERNTEGSYEVVVVLSGPNEKGKKIAQAFDFVKLVELDEPAHFSVAYNRGLAEAEGTHLVVMNDDVIVTPGWNVALMNCLTRFDKKKGLEYGVPKPAIVGPVSNNVGGPQMIPSHIAQRIIPENCEEAAKEITAQNQEAWLPVTFISGFCMMIDSGFYHANSPEFFDERIENGAEDNLIALKALFQGYSNIICGDCFIFHYGSRTIEQTNPDGGRGVRNLLDYYRIAREEVLPKVNVVASACRVRLMDEHDVGTFLQAVDQHLGLADVLCIVNDRSDKEVWETVEKYMAAKVEETGTPIRIHTFACGHDEYRDRTMLLALANGKKKPMTVLGDDDGTPANWFLSFDHDEIFEEKFDRPYLERLLTTPRPDHLQFSFHWYTLWDPAGAMWRADSTFGRMCGARLGRILPGYQMKKTQSGLHMGNIPGVGMVNAHRITSVRIKHYGYQTAEERRRKYDFYSEIDTERNAVEIGSEDYSHLISGLVQLTDWYEDSGVTIGTLVLNEEIGLHNFLDYLWAFADRMVFCDTGSEDRTVELLEFFGAKVLSFDDETGLTWDPTFATEGGDLGKARNLIIPHVDTKWFWHYDIDEQLIVHTEGPAAGDPLAVIRRLMDKPGVDAFQFMFQNLHPTGKYTISQATRLIRDPGDWHYTGYTHETMDEAAEGKKVDLCPIQVRHNGWLIEEEAAGAKLENYLRGNLRMMQDYPQDCRDWFNTALHLGDAGYQQAMIQFITQALIRKRSFVAAQKELIVQGAKQLFDGCRKLSESSPPGHPFDQYARELAANLKEYMADNEELTRCPEHVDKVLSDEQFADIRSLVLRAEGRDQLVSSESQETSGEPGSESTGPVREDSAGLS